MPLMQIGSDHFYIEVAGPESAPPLMLSNSLGTTLRMWDDQMAELTKRFHVIRYDSRGHGASIADDTPISIARLGHDALAILDKLGIEKTHWLGLSKGGMVGQWLLANAPHRLRRVVLANTGARMGPPNNWNGRIRTVRSKGMAAITQAVVDRWFTPEFQAASPEAVARVAALIGGTPAIGYANCCAAIRDMDQREAIRSATNPVLVIVGTQDPATPPEAGELIRDAIPGARLVALEAAHLSNIEQPQAFTRAVLEFLA